MFVLIRWRKNYGEPDDWDVGGIFDSAEIARDAVDDSQKLVQWSNEGNTCTGRGHYAGDYSWTIQPFEVNQLAVLS